MISGRWYRRHLIYIYLFHFLFSSFFSISFSPLITCPTTEEVRTRSCWLGRSLRNFFAIAPPEEEEEEPCLKCWFPELVVRRQEQGNHNWCVTSILSALLWGLSSHHWLGVKCQCYALFWWGATVKSRHVRGRMRRFYYNSRTPLLHSCKAAALFVVYCQSGQYFDRTRCKKYAQATLLTQDSLLGCWNYAWGSGIYVHLGKNI